MMRWIANENVSGTVIRTLRDRGHDVLSVKESLRGTGDPHILAREKGTGTSRTRSQSPFAVCSGSAALWRELRQRKVLKASQIELARAQERKGVHAAEAVVRRNPQGREAEAGQRPAEFLG